MGKPCEAMGSSWKTAACSHPPSVIFTSTAQLQPPASVLSPLLQWQDQAASSSSPRRAAGGERGAQLPGGAGPEPAQPVL